jgi:hypothetical protein
MLGPHKHFLRKARILGAVIGVFVGMSIGRVLDGLSSGHTGPLMPLFIGGAAVAGYFLGPFIAKKLRQRREQQNSNPDQ